MLVFNMLTGDSVDSPHPHQLVNYTWELHRTEDGTVIVKNLLGFNLIFVHCLDPVLKKFATREKGDHTCITQRGPTHLPYIVGKLG